MKGQNLPCRAITLDEVYELSFTLAENILQSTFRPDIIIAIARGGFTPARFLCDFLNVRAMSSVSVRHYGAAAEVEARAHVLFPLSADIRDRNVLLVDDVNDTGDSLQVAFEHLAGHSPAKLRTAVLHEKTNTSFQVDFKAEIITEWRWVLYPWARTEDVGGLIQKEYRAVDDIAELQKRLRDDHQLEIPRDALKKILSIYSKSYET